MRINFYGGVETVTGSMHVLDVGNKRILLDCGLFQGRRKEAEKINRDFPFDVKSIDAMILSHAHIDHSGNIPNLVKQGYEGPIIATEATVDLCEYMLKDSGYIHEKDVEYLNKKRKRNKGVPLLEPLYTVEDAEISLQSFEKKRYNEPFELVDGVEATFHDAGHILGAALTHLKLRENGRTVNFGYILDLGRRNLPILRNPEIIKNLDYMIIESTYGNRLHDNIQVAEEMLFKVIKRTVDRGGKVIIPSFALERTQEIVYCLNNLWNMNKLPRIPVFVDSPLAVNVTSVFREHPECFDEKTQQILQYDDDPFGFDKLTYVRNVEESKKINDLNEPCIIISASGMAETGRILHHLKNNIENPRNTIMIVGFMAQHTLGRKLVEHWERVKIFGVEYNRRAEVVVMNAFSAHADRNDLINYVQQANQKLKGVYLVHGEESQTEALRKTLVEMNINGVKAPDMKDSYKL
ncbi:MAG: MBL fold metallo-hydrolase [candidate division KSB1 bacterium]|jgi:metallo-beta-lactamase family protein|nr:MBL fold metallo-hydrolase [candidate division KSB1 bacterium]